MSKLPPLIAALLKPEAYHPKPQKVGLVQTQMSFILLAGGYVYKIKKPVNLGYLDCTTLEKRRFFCQQEVELNRRLSPDVYLEVLPVTKSGERFRLGGDGEIVEYTVKMKRLSEDRMMDKLLIAGQMTADMAARVAAKVAEFHQKAATNPEISFFGGLDMIRTNTEENFTQTEKYIGVSVPANRYNRIRNHTNSFVDSNIPLFQRRVDTGKIRDCHGDLHAAHVCFSDGIYIYDCIEFNDRFRYSDVASEIAFLAMDLDRYQRADLSRAFVGAYVSLSGDDELLQLLDFYKCYRAYVRGKVACFKYDDPYISDSEREATLASAKEYFALAYWYTREKPILFVTAGLVGTGKTTVAEALGLRLGATVVSSDVTRKKLAGISPTERRFEQFGGGIYTEDFSEKTYSDLFAQATKLLSSRHSVILDASFKKRQDRLRAKGLADEANADFMVLECVSNADTIRSRLERRVREGSVSDGRWEIYESQKQDFDEVTELPAQNHMVLDTSRPVSEIIKAVWERI